MVHKERLHWKGLRHMMISFASWLVKMSVQSSLQEMRCGVRRAKCENELHSIVEVRIGQRAGRLTSSLDPSRLVAIYKHKWRMNKWMKLWNLHLPPHEVMVSLRASSMIIAVMIIKRVGSLCNWFDHRIVASSPSTSTVDWVCRRLLVCGRRYHVPANRKLKWLKYGQGINDDSISWWGEELLESVIAGFHDIHSSLLPTDDDGRKKNKISFAAVMRPDPSILHPLGSDVSMDTRCSLSPSRQPSPPHLASCMPLFPLIFELKLLNVVASEKEWMNGGRFRSEAGASLLSEFSISRDQLRFSSIIFRFLVLWYCFCAAEDWVKLLILPRLPLDSNKLIRLVSCSEFGLCSFPAPAYSFSLSLTVAHSISPVEDSSKAGRQQAGGEKE